MIRHPFIVLIAAGMLSAPAMTQAQVGPSYRGGGNQRFQNTLRNKPAVSPYLNLMRPGNVANNYYNLVRPEFQQLRVNNEFESNFQQMQRQMMEQPVAGANPNLPVTGHSTHYMHHSHYYGNLPVGGGGGGARPRGTVSAISGQGYGRQMGSQMGSRFSTRSMIQQGSGAGMMNRGR
ncbi:MAG: hypothetical protein K1X71_16635 [Pirellulales bacterium]|nr:hypothetical protein [Pirellulales bacterium]